MADPLMVFLRLLHIGAGVLWVGAALTVHFFVVPSLRALGPDTERSVMDTMLRQRRLATTILIATVITVAAGATMYVIDVSRYGTAAWFGSGFGIGITIGAVAALISFILGPVAILPITKQLEKIGGAIQAQGGQPTAEQEGQMVALGSRLDRVLRYDTAVLIVAVIFMAIARYL